MNIEEYIEDKLADIKGEKERLAFERSIRFLIDKKALADFDYWSKVPTWTGPETSLLLNFIEPRVIFKQPSRDVLDAGKGLMLIDQSSEALVIFDRAIAAGQIPGISHPLSMLNYAKKVGLTMPTSLFEKVIAVHDRGLEFDAAVEKQLETLMKSSPSVEEDLNLRKRENLHLLIGILKTALIDPNNKTLPFANQDTLGQWLEANFVDSGPKLTGKGLKYGTLRHEFAKINKLLEAVNIDPEPKLRPKEDG